MRYFITFSCYGAHLHGEESGSVDRRHNLYGSRLLGTNPQLASAESREMQQAPYQLDPDSRAAVMDALQNVCLHRGWTLLAAHVRTNHAHAIVEAGVRPEKVMSDFKSYASRGSRLSIERSRLSIERSRLSIERSRLSIEHSPANTKRPCQPTI
jgi:hypothetical protein